MTTPKGLSVTILKQTQSGKSGCLTDEADVSLTPNTGDTYYYMYKYEIFLQPCY